MPTGRLGHMGPVYDLQLGSLGVATAHLSCNHSNKDLFTDNIKWLLLTIRA